MRSLRTVIKLSTFPAAVVACIVWVAIFVIIGFKLPNENVGTVTLLVFSGLALMFPWLTLVLAVMQRIGGKPDSSSDIVVKP